MSTVVDGKHVKGSDTRGKVPLTRDQEIVLEDPGPVQTGRPAETAGGLGALATAIALALSASVEVVAAAGIAAGLLPAAVTYLVSHGGIRGVFRSLWRGRD